MGAFQQILPGKSKKLKGGTCAYCKRKVFPGGHPNAYADPRSRATRDHIEPQVVKGFRDPMDAVLACHECNSIKSHYPAEVFLYFLRQCHGTDKYTAAEFKRFVYHLTMAGFREATRQALQCEEIV